MISPTLFAFVALILLASSFTDLKSHRIPNVLSLGGALVALILHAVAGGLDSVLFGLGGLAAGFILFLPSG